MASRDYPDHARLLGLLWRTSDEPSPRSGLTVAKVVRAGIDVGDAEGLAAVTMRRLADDLGVGAMSLYTYVPGKDELVALMVDEVLAELPADDVTAHEHWRARLESIARSYWALFERHPWLVEVALARPAIGPHAADRYELELAAVEGIGLDDIEMNATIELIQRHAESTARKALEIARDVERSGMSDDEWWYSILPTLTRVMADRNYPLSSRVGQTIGAPHVDPIVDFEFGLARILDGLAILVVQRSGSDA